MAVDEALPADPKDRRKALEDTERELVDITRSASAKVDRGLCLLNLVIGSGALPRRAPLCFPAADDAPVSDDLAAKSAAGREAL